MIKSVKSFLRRIGYPLVYVFYRAVFGIKFSKAFRKGGLSHLSKEDFDVWKRSMCEMIREYWAKGHYGFIRRKVVFSFCDAHIEVVRKTAPCDRNDPIVTLCVRNDIRRIKMLVEHYRALGVAKFAILDNGSDDGTFEWMQSQPDVDLYRCLERYQTNVKEGWINRIISHYGFGRWYIVTDSDELAVYPGMEEIPLPELTARLEAAGVKRVKAITLDTYSDKPLFEESADIRKDFRWIDSDSYKERTANAGIYRIRRFIGGPRYRLMNSGVPLDKHPLVYWEKGTVSADAHYQYPHDVINDAPCFMGVLHYKFIDADLEEYRKRASGQSTFVGNGSFYRQYMAFFDGQEGRTMTYDGSVEFNSSEALNKIRFIDWRLPG